MYIMDRVEEKTDLTKKPVFKRYTDISYKTYLLQEISVYVMNQVACSTVE